MMKERLHGFIPDNHFLTFPLQPYLAQAEHEKMEYEAARRLYEEGTTGFGTSINFSILPGSPLFPAIKVESESESEGLPLDGFNNRH